MGFYELFLVLTLTAYANANLKDPSSFRHECKGPTLCDEPSDYPQEEVDKLVAQNLHYRMRRSNPDVDGTSSGTDLCVSTSKMVKPFTLLQKDVLHAIQADLLSQEIRETSCKYENTPCLNSGALAIYGIRRSVCSTKISSIKVDLITKTNESLQVPVDVKVGCVCVFARD